MAQDKEKFLDRWSRLKSENKLPEKKDNDDSPAPVLPALDKLTPESDFTGFMHPKVEDALRRAALKKLFSDPQFNIPDPFEPYSRDFTVSEAISDEMLATLNQARTLLFDKEEKKQEQDQQQEQQTPGGDAVAEQQPESKDDEPGRKDA